MGPSNPSPPAPPWGILIFWVAGGPESGWAGPAAPKPVPIPFAKPKPALGLAIARALIRTLSVPLECRFSLWLWLWLLNAAASMCVLPLAEYALLIVFRFASVTFQVLWVSACQPGYLGTVLRQARATTIRRRERCKCQCQALLVSVTQMVLSSVTLVRGALQSACLLGATQPALLLCESLSAPLPLHCLKFATYCLLSIVHS